MFSSENNSYFKGVPFKRFATEQLDGYRGRDKRKVLEILEVYNPAGAIDITELHAPRLNSLRGKTICELSNRLWEDFRIFPKIRGFIKKRSPDVKIVPYTEFPNIYGVKEDVLIEQLKDEGCDAIIVGNAA